MQLLRFQLRFSPPAFPPTPSWMHIGDHSSFCLKWFSFCVLQHLTGSLLLHAEQGGTDESFISLSPQKVGS